MEEKEHKVIGERLLGRAIHGFSCKDRVVTIEFSGEHSLEITARGGQRLNFRLFDPDGIIRE